MEEDYYYYYCDVSQDNSSNLTSSGCMDYDVVQHPPEIAMGLSIHKNYLKVLCAVGLPGNLAAILTIATVKPLSAATFLVALLAASDSMALIVKLVLNQLGILLDHYTHGFCRSLPLANMLSTFANWVLVLIALERLVAVVLPLMRFRLLSKPRVYCICLIMALLISAEHAPLIIGGTVLWENHCGVTDSVRHYKDHVWSWLSSIVCALLPLLLLLIINSGLCLALNLARRHRERLLGSATMYASVQSNRETRRSEWAITAMVIAASLLFMLLLLPQCLYFILFYYAKLFTHLTSSPSEFLLRQVVTLLADTTHALNFYLYFISVKRFRQRFLTLIQCQGRFCPLNRRSPQFSSFSSRSTVRESISLNGAHGVGRNTITTPTPSPGARTARVKREGMKQQESSLLRGGHSSEKVPVKTNN